jgi:hypothetical protein
MQPASVRATASTGSASTASTARTICSLLNRKE